MLDVLDEFLDYCEIERGLAELTCKAYRHDVATCISYLASLGIHELDDVKVVHLRRFLTAESAHRPAPGSRARVVVAIRQFFRFCVDNDHLLRSPAATLRTPKKREALPDVLDQAELHRLLRVPAAEGVWQRRFSGRVERDRLLLALLAFGGLRRAELLGLDVDDVNLDTMLLRIRHAKGGRQRVLPIHPALVPLFDAYIATRLPIGTEHALSSASKAAASPRRSSPPPSAATPTPPASTSTSASPPHPPPRLRHRAPRRRRQPPPDPRAPRPQAPRLHPALHPRQRQPTPWGRQAAAVAGDGGGLTGISPQRSHFQLARRASTS